MNQDPDVLLSNEDVPCIIEEKVLATHTSHDDRGPTVSWRDNLKQIIAGCISFCLVIQVGANMSFSSILVPQLAKEGSSIRVTRTEASWIASIVAIALPFGALIVGPLMDMFGRKVLCIVLTIPFCIGWLFQIFGSKLWHIYVARFIAGFTGGLTTVVIVYISEISHPTLRQALLSLNSVFVSLGVLLTYFFGTLFGWKVTAIFMCTSSLVCAFSISCLPESPYWYLIFKNNYQGAQRSFRWLYKQEEVYDSQYQHLLQIKTKKRNNTQSEQTRLQSIKSEIQLYTERAVYKPTIILILIFFAQQITGGYVIIFYATDIFRKLEGQNQNQGISEFKSLVCLGIIRFLSSVISAVISKGIGRRVILIISGIGMAFCSFFAGVYLYFTMLPNDEIAAMHITSTDKTYNIAYIFVLGYVAFGSLGFLVVPWTLIGELLPVKVRGVLGGFLISFAYLLMFLSVKIFPTMLDSIDIQCILYAVSVMNLLSVMFVYFFLPETLGKNFSEIERYFER